MNLTEARPLSKEYSFTKDNSPENGLFHAASEKFFAPKDHSTNNTDLESLNQQVLSLF